VSSIAFSPESGGGSGEGGRRARTSGLNPCQCHRGPRQVKSRHKCNLVDISIPNVVMPADVLALTVGAMEEVL
jgi:hypothetical protein